jgi:hypothetical protein
VRLGTLLEKPIPNPQINTSEWNRPEQEFDWPIARRQPFRAIVKELVKSKTRFRAVAQMRKDLLTLQDMGGYAHDISAKIMSMEM